MPTWSTDGIFRFRYKNPNNPVKDLKRRFTAEETQVAGKRAQRC